MIEETGVELGDGAPEVRVASDLECWVNWFQAQNEIKDVLLVEMLENHDLPFRPGNKAMKTVQLIKYISAAV